jgi:hypothetical protein
MIERQVRYNFKTDFGEQEEFTRHRWTFLIINEPKEINRIRERIYEQLQPIVEPKNLDNGLITRSGGLHYDFFSFSTQKSRIERPDKIYHSKKFKKDRDLSERDAVCLAKYLQPILTGRKQ